MYDGLTESERENLIKPISTLLIRSDKIRILPT